MQPTESKPTESRYESLSQADSAVMSHSVKPTEPLWVTQSSRLSRYESLSQVDSTITMTLSQADWAITITLGRAITSLSIKDKYSVFSHKIIILVFGCQSIYLSVCLCIRLTSHSSHFPSFRFRLLINDDKDKWWWTSDEKQNWLRTNDDKTNL